MHGDEPAGPLAALELLKHGAFDHGPWPRMSGAERAKYLNTVAELIGGTDTDDRPGLGARLLRESGLGLVLGVMAGFVDQAVKLGVVPFAVVVDRVGAVDVAQVVDDPPVVVGELAQGDAHLQGAVHGEILVPALRIDEKAAGVGAVDLVRGQGAHVGDTLLDVGAVGHVAHPVVHPGDPAGAAVVAGGEELLHVRKEQADRLAGGEHRRADMGLFVDAADITDHVPMLVGEHRDFAFPGHALGEVLVPAVRVEQAALFVHRVGGAHIGQFTHGFSLSFMVTPACRSLPAGAPMVAGATPSAAAARAGNNV